MIFSEMNIFGWIFLISLAVFFVGALGWYLNRSKVELEVRMNRGEDVPKYSYLQEWLLPKYRVTGRRWANKKFHSYVDAKARNKVHRFFLWVMAVGAFVQIALWIYVGNFTTGDFSFLNKPS